MLLRPGQRVGETEECGTMGMEERSCEKKLGNRVCSAWRMWLRHGGGGAVSQPPFPTSVKGVIACRPAPSLPSTCYLDVGLVFHAHMLELRGRGARVLYCESPRRPVNAIAHAESVLDLSWPCLSQDRFSPAYSKGKSPAWAGGREDPRG